MNLLKLLKKYEEEGKALGHFNIANFDMLKAISNVAERYELPMVIGTSEGEWGYLGCDHVADMIESYNNKYSKGGEHLFLNGDHTHTVDKLKELVKSGYDMVIFDAADSGFEENIKKTKKAVEVVKKINPEVLVEGELGYIGSSSKLLDEVPKDASINLEDLPTAEEAEEFVKRTGVDLLAPAVGNIHGMMKNASNPSLNIERIKEVSEAVNVPLVLHGGSGLSDDDFKEAIRAGISMIHVSTEIRNAWRKSLEEALKEPDEIAPYKVVPPVISAIEEVIEKKCKLFYNF
ncbi:MAG TPA: class II fructose-bisphosphate aldolase [Candidatus Paceibacterota bacterium]|nr:class II fructose-bisphosphate aldolase [Candidatus Paceibacterota bacterium]